MQLLVFKFYIGPKTNHFGRQIAYWVTKTTGIQQNIQVQRVCKRLLDNFTILHKVNELCFIIKTGAPYTKGIFSC